MNLCNFFAVAASARLLDRFGRALSQRTDRIPIFVMMCAAIVVLGLLDQTTPQFVPHDLATAQAFRFDQQFAGEIVRASALFHGGGAS